MKFFTFIFIAFALTQPALSQLATDKIIIAGDSWALFPCKYNSMEKMIKLTKIRLENDVRCRGTSKFGMTAADWSASPQNEMLNGILRTDHNIKYIYLSLGGNDFLRHWNANMTADEELKLMETAYNHLKEIAASYINVRPDVKVIISGYDFSNFTKDRTSSFLKKLYRKLGQPTPLAINTAQVNFSRHMIGLSDRKNIFYIHHLGLTHYYDGGPNDVFAPQATLQPSEISSFNNPEAVGGDINYPARDRALMVWYKLFHDGFHLNDKNFLNVMLHTYNNVLTHIMN